MELKAVDRLTEVRAAYTINRIYNYKNQEIAQKHIKILKNLVITFNENDKERFFELVEESGLNKILGATNKEILASFTLFEKSLSKRIKRMGYNSPTQYYYRFRDLKDRGFMTEEFINTLEPKLDDDGLKMCKLINKFLDVFDYSPYEKCYPRYDHQRVIEIEFYLIIKSLKQFFGESTLLETFLYKLCMDCEIDWGTVSYMFNSLYLIERRTNLIGPSKTQFKNEVFNLGYLKGMSKYKIAQDLLHLPGKYVYTNGYTKIVKDITNNEWEFQLTFSPTLEWSRINDREALKFIELFRSFAYEQL